MNQLPTSQAAPISRLAPTLGSPQLEVLLWAKIRRQDNASLRRKQQRNPLRHRANRLVKNPASQAVEPDAGAS